jgi:uncharacterized repeat protein (TIGR02543 family)
VYTSTGLAHATAAYSTGKLTITPDTGYEFTNVNNVAVTPLSTNTKLTNGALSNGVITYDVTLPANDSVTLTGAATAKSYTITYNLNDPDTTDQVSVSNTSNTKTAYTIEDSAITLADASYTGYTFLGWYDGDTKVTSIPTGSTGDITLDAKWQKTSYTLSVEFYTSGALSGAMQKTANKDATEVIAKASNLAIISENGIIKAIQADATYTTSPLAADTTVKVVYNSSISYSVDYTAAQGYTATGNSGTFTAASDSISLALTKSSGNFSQSGTLELKYTVNGGTTQYTATAAVTNATATGTFTISAATLAAAGIPVGTGSSDIEITVVSLGWQTA